MLAWHKEGCYAVAFADVGAAEGGNEGEAGGLGDEGGTGEDGGSGDGGAVVRAGGGGKRVGRTTVRSRREDRVRAVHWLAAGSKDGKVSLWEVF